MEFVGCGKGVHPVRVKNHAEGVMAVRGVFERRETVAVPHPRHVDGRHKLPELLMRAQKRAGLLLLLLLLLLLGEQLREPFITVKEQGPQRHSPHYLLVCTALQETDVLAQVAHREA